MRLIIVRHGETLENAARVVQGQLPGTLSGRGRLQAEALGAALSRFSMDAIYSSDLARALETARIISGRLDPPVPVIEDARLREQDLGLYQGGPAVALMRRLKEEGAEITAFDPEGGERAREFRGRVKEMAGLLLSRHSRETALLVTHHGFMLMFLDIFARGMDPGRKKILTRSGTAAVAAFDGPQLREICSMDCWARRRDDRA